MTDFDLAKLSALCYDPSADAFAAAFPRERYGLLKYAVVESLDQLAIVMDDPTVTHYPEKPADKVVAFRGSCSLLNWVEDALCIYTSMAVPAGLPASPGMVLTHSGFDLAGSILDRELSMVIEGCERLILTGHSLGGALATRAAVRRRNQVAKLRTFGCPRVGNGAYANLLSGLDYVRYHHAFDPVCMLPFIGWGYRHPCWPQWWDGAAWGELSLTKVWCDAALRVIKRLWQERGRILRDALTDHNIDNYVQALTPKEIHHV